MNIRRRELLKKSIILSFTLPILAKIQFSVVTQPTLSSNADIDLKKIGDNSYLADGWVLKHSDFNRL